VGSDGELLYSSSEWWLRAVRFFLAQHYLPLSLLEAADGPLELGHSLALSLSVSRVRDIHKLKENHDDDIAVWFPLCYDSQTITSFEEILRDANFISLQLGDSYLEHKAVNHVKRHPSLSRSLDLYRTPRQGAADILWEEEQERQRDFQLWRIRRWFDEVHSTLSQCDISDPFWSQGLFSLTVIESQLGAKLSKHRIRKIPRSLKSNIEAPPLSVLLSGSVVLSGPFRFGIVSNPFSLSLSPNSSLFTAQEDSQPLAECSSIVSYLLVDNPEDDVVYISYVSRKSRERESRRGSQPRIQLMEESKGVVATTSVGVEGETIKSSEDSQVETNQFLLPQIVPDYLPLALSKSPSLSPMIESKKLAVGRALDHRSSYSSAPPHLSLLQHSTSRYVSFCDLHHDPLPQFRRAHDFEVASLESSTKKDSKWTLPSWKRDRVKNLSNTPMKEKVGMEESGGGDVGSGVGIGGGGAVDEYEVIARETNTPLRVYNQYIIQASLLAASSLFSMDRFVVTSSHLQPLSVVVVLLFFHFGYDGDDDPHNRSTRKSARPRNPPSFCKLWGLKCKRDV